MYDVVLAARRMIDREVGDRAVEAALENLDRVQDVYRARFDARGDLILMTGDQQWTRFVRSWRDLMRRLFSPRCSRSAPCCSFDCPDLATHFARTGDHS